jgi:hypothetical protein
MTVLKRRNEKETHMDAYSYQECLDRAHRVNWSIDDVVGGREFNLAKPWLPSTLSGSAYLPDLAEDEKMKLTQVEMGAYAHLFGYVEEFIAPKMSEHARDFAAENGSRFHALANFVAEEVKHMALFRRVRKLVNETLGFDLKLVEDPQGTARFVLSKSDGAVLLLTACIEWFTQRHYLEAFQSGGEVDPFTKEIFKSHWLEESQHAKLDHNETLRSFEKMTEAERDRAVDDLIALVAAVDGLLQKQATYDVENFERRIDRTLSAMERQEIYEAVLKAKRFTFLWSGVTHERFIALFGYVTTPAQQGRVAAAMETLQ